MIFASVGYKVSIFDIVESQVTTALKQAEAQLKTLEQKGLLRGNFTAAEQFSFIEGCTDLVKALDGAFFLQGKLWRWLFFCKVHMKNIWTSQNAFPRISTWRRKSTLNSMGLSTIRSFSRHRHRLSCHLCLLARWSIALKSSYRIQLIRLTMCHLLRLFHPNGQSRRLRRELESCKSLFSYQHCMLYSSN